ncbi:hypothetical protein [Streptomyces sp. NPDC039016]|uniref:hypothetical protein n=1 Tax=Streptomyces sp. NPDC039016 TaxID=3154330 RepID=UPI0033EC9FA6
MKTSRVSSASRTSLRAICTAALLAGAVAVPTTAFAAGTPRQQDRPASADTAHTAPRTPAKDKVRAVGIGGGMEAVIHNGVCDLQTIGSGKPFARLKKGQSYTRGIRVHFDGTYVYAKPLVASSHGRTKPGPVRTVKLTNGAQATVQKVNGSYTAKIHLKNKQIATLSSTHRSVTHEGVRYTVNPADGKVAVQGLKKRQGMHGAKRRVIHATAQRKSFPQRQAQTPVMRQAQTPVTSQLQAPVTGQAQIPATGQAQAPLAGQAQTPVAGEAQTPFYGGGGTRQAAHRADGARAGAVAMSFAAASSGGGR